MTRKDFDKIARILNNAFPIDEDFVSASDYWQLLVQRFALELAETNANFNTERFIAACKKE